MDIPHQPPTPAIPTTRTQRWVLGGLLASYAAVVLNTAWLDDDCFITFRVVDNMAHGYGPRWNVGERVQVYTHPLWFLLIAAVHAVTREFFFSVLSLSIALSLATAWVFASWKTLGVELRALGLMVLLSSTSFVDYSTSGLENPLTHLLLVCFYRWGQPLRSTARGCAGLLGLVGLIALNREDALLLVLPATVYLCATMPWRLLLRSAAIGLSPLLAWKAFSLVYYGTLIPNTAYAKLITGSPWFDRMQLGLLYFADQLRNDPLSCAVIAAALAAAAIGREPRTRLMAAGIALQLVYVLSIGGSFMLGRYFAAPTLLAVLVLAQLPWRPRHLLSPAVGAAAILGLALVPTYPTLTADAGFGLDGDRRAKLTASDERFFYYPENGLIPALLRGSHTAGHEFHVVGTILRALGGVHAWGAVGMLGLAAGPGVHVVDIYGITDPLLARLPAWQRQTPPWMFGGVGHLARRLPIGYLHSLRDGRDRFQDRQLAKLYSQLLLITRGPLWSADRWHAIAAQHLGGGVAAPADYATRYPRSVPGVEVGLPQYDGQMSQDAIAIDPAEGLRVETGRIEGVSWLDASLYPRGYYRFQFSRGGKVVAVRGVVVPKGPDEGVVRVLVPVPPYVDATRWDAITITPIKKEMRAFVGHLRPLSGYRTELELADLAQVKKDGSPWNAPGTVELFSRVPVQVRLPAITFAGRWDISVDFNDIYAIDFHRAGELIATREVLPQRPAVPGLRRLQVEVPRVAVRGGYDEIRLRLVAGDAYASVGHLIPIP